MKAPLESPATPPTGRRYRVELEAKPGIIGDQSIRSLRAILKALGRAYHLRCVSVEPINPPVDEVESS